MFGIVFSVERLVNIFRFERSLGGLVIVFCVVRWRILLGVKKLLVFCIVINIFLLGWEKIFVMFVLLERLSLRL